MLMDASSDDMIGYYNPDSYKGCDGKRKNSGKETLMSWVKKVIAEGEKGVI